MSKQHPHLICIFKVLSKSNNCGLQPYCIPPLGKNGKRRRVDGMIENRLGQNERVVQFYNILFGMHATGV